MAGSADVIPGNQETQEYQENKPELKKNVKKFLNTFLHVYRNSNEFDNPIQSQPVFVSDPYIDIEFVRPSDIDLSSPSPSVCTNPLEIAMYDIDMDYTQTPCMLNMMIL